MLHNKPLPTRQPQEIRSVCVCVCVCVCVWLGEEEDVNQLSVCLIVSVCLLKEGRARFGWHMRGVLCESVFSFVDMWICLCVCVCVSVCVCVCSFVADSEQLREQWVCVMRESISTAL